MAGLQLLPWKSFQHGKLNTLYGIILQYDEFQQSVAIPEGRRMTLMICYLFQLNGSVIRNKGSGYHDFWRPFATKIGLSSVC